MSQKLRENIVVQCDLRSCATDRENIGKVQELLDSKDDNMNERGLVLSTEKRKGIILVREISRFRTWYNVEWVKTEEN